MFYPNEKMKLITKIQYMARLSVAARSEFLSVLRMMMWRTRHSVINRKEQGFVYAL